MILEDIFAFEEGIYNNNIYDGGNDLFDGVNYINCNSNERYQGLQYVDNTVVGEA
jgi:hypothetical protein